jgi:hypothetical protein
MAIGLLMYLGFHPTSFTDIKLPIVIQELSYLRLIPMRRKSPTQLEKELSANWSFFGQMMIFGCQTTILCLFMNFI